MSDFALTVTPGLTIPTSGNWTLTPAKARLLAQPAVSYSGTFGAAVISDGSITPAKMSATFITGLSDVTTLAADDKFWIYDTSAATSKYCTALEIKTYVLGGVSGSLPPPAALTDTLVFTRAGTNYNGSVQVLFDGFGTLTEVTAPTSVDIANDLVPYYADGDSATKSAKPRTLVRAVTENLRTTTHSSPAYAIATSNLDLSAYASGIRLLVKFNAANAAGATLNVDSVGAKALRTADDYAVLPGELTANMITEVIYSADANSAAGGWLVQNVRRVGGEFAGVVFDGSVTIGSVTSVNTTSGSEVFTTGSAHGLATDQVVWPDAVSGLTAYTPLYVHVLTTTTFKLATSKANRAAGTFVSPGTASSGVLNYWNTVGKSPILGTARNVDGIVRIAPGKYRVDFAVDPTNEFYRRHALVKQQLTGYWTLINESYDYPATTDNCTFEVADFVDNLTNPPVISVSFHV